MRTPGFLLRLAVLATALVVGPATLAPGTAEAPAGDLRTGAAALAGDGTTAAKRYGWRTMQWDFAWEFGESLSDGAYRGQRYRGGRWVDKSTGTGRVVKYGGGLEFHSGEPTDGTKDRGDTELTLRGKPARRGRWELRERIRLERDPRTRYAFVVELIPDDPARYDCGAHNLTIARAVVGGTSVKVGVNAGSTSWSKTLTGFRRSEGEGRLYAVQVTRRRITWFVNGRAVASLGARAAIPKMPMTVRMRLDGKGTDEMRKSEVLIDWLRNYDLNKGKRPRRGAALTKGRFGAAC